MNRRKLLFSVALLLMAAPAFAARDVLVVLDNSGSMRHNDPAKLAGPAVEEFIKSQPRDTRVGIILFSGDAQLVMPLTPTEVAADGAAADALQRFNYRGARTQIAAGVERALYELRNEGRGDAQRVIVLMTDGLIDSGDSRKDAELDDWLRKDLSAQAAKEKIGIFGIAFTEQADYQLLQSLAAATGAEYFRVLNAGGIAKALQRIETALGSASAAAAAPAPGPAAPTTVAPAPEASAPIEAAATPADGRRFGWIGWLAMLLALAVVGGGFAWWYQYGRKAQDKESHTAPVKRRPLGVQAVLYDSMERHELGDRPVVIGRAGGSDPTRYYVIVPEKTVGRWHATIERRGQTFWIRDEGSVNGTFVNGERIYGERPLKHHDQVRFHNHQFEFEIPELGDFDRTVMQPHPHPMN